MNTTKNTALKALKLGQMVKLASGENTKKGIIAAKIAAGKLPNTNKFPGLRIFGKPRATASFVIDVKGKYFWPRLGAIKNV